MAFTITEKQKLQLIQNGYTHLPNALPEHLLNRWRQIADRLEQEALIAFQQGKPRHGACVVDYAGTPHLIRQDDLLHEEMDAVLDLLSCPAMMAIAREMCGRGAVPLQVDLLYKHPHSQSIVQWHQDAPPPQESPLCKYRYIS